MNPPPSLSPSPLPSSAIQKSFIDNTCRGGEQFVELYYKVYDTQRHLLSRFYKDSSKVIWNGNPYASVKTLSDFFENLPPSKFHILSFDCQPLLAASSLASTSSPATPSPASTPFTPNSPTMDMTILVVVNGQVNFGEKGPRPFAQTFVLMPSEKGAFFVSSDCFRFV
eukprot:Sdes_comp20647_c0_seq5m15903